MALPRKAACGRCAAALLVLAAGFAGAPTAEARTAQSADDAALARPLARAMRSAGRYSGAHVVNATDGRTVFRRRAGRPRILASNAKLFTTAAALARFGVAGTLGTEIRGRGAVDGEGVWRGDLYLVGGGDPTFGSRSFARRAYGTGATVEGLADRLELTGIERVTGRVYGDESAFDSRRGTSASGWRTSIWIGPLSGLAYNRGLARQNGSSFQANPPAFAAARLDAALERRGIRVARPPRAGRTPAGAQVLASVRSPTMARLAQLTNKPSDNFFAEMLVKAMAMQRYGRGTTLRGARLASGFARRLGARAKLVDGSGLSRADRASPAAVVRLLLAMLARDESLAFRRSLAVAGRDGTLARRMRRGPARGRCRGKTGTLSGVSALSGYCRARSGDLYAFSLLMNGVGVNGARSLQDRISQTLAGMR